MWPNGVAQSGARSGNAGHGRRFSPASSSAPSRWWHWALDTPREPYRTGRDGRGCCGQGCSRDLRSRSQSYRHRGMATVVLGQDDCHDLLQGRTRGSWHAGSQPGFSGLVPSGPNSLGSACRRAAILSVQRSSDSVSVAAAVGGCRSAVPASRHAVGPDVAADGDAGDPEQPGGRPHREPRQPRLLDRLPAGELPGRGSAELLAPGLGSAGSCSPPSPPRWQRGAAGVLLQSRALRRCARGPGSGPARSAPPSAPPRAAVPRVRGSSPPGAERRARRRAAPPPRPAPPRSWAAQARAAAGACASGT